MKRKVFIVILLFAATLAWFIQFYAPKFIVEIKNPVIETARANFYDTHTPQKTNATFENFDFEGAGHTVLNANLFLSEKQPAKATLILVHGIRSSKEENTSVALWLTKQAYNVVAVDLRAHGQSQGEYCTFGYYEKQDIKKLVDYLISKKKITTPFGIWGHSLGAAISLQALAIDKRLKFGIIESTYADFSTITKDYGKQFSSIDSDWLNDYLLERAGEMADFDITAVNPIDYAGQISQPVLIVHGKNDTNIKWQYSKQVFDKLSDPEKEFILVDKAGHNDIHSVGGKQYFHSVSFFIEKVLP